MTKGILLEARPKWPDVQDDFIVRCEGLIIGRVRLEGERYAHGNTWEWTITHSDACMKEFTAAWARLVKETSPARMKRDLELERAFVARQKRMGRVDTGGG